MYAGSLTRIQRPGVDARLIRRVNAEFGSPTVADFGGLGSFFKKVKKAVSIKNVVKGVKAVAPIAVAAVATGGIGVGAALASKGIKSALVSAAKSTAGNLIKSAVAGGTASASVPVMTTVPSKCGTFDIKCRLAKSVGQAAAVYAPASQQGTQAARDIAATSAAISPSTSPEAVANALTSDHASEGAYAPRAAGFALDGKTVAIAAGIGLGLMLLSRRR